VLLYLGIPIILILAVTFISFLNKGAEKKKYYEIVDLIKTNQVSEYKLNLYSGQLTYKLRTDDKTYRYTVADASLFIRDVEEAVEKIKELDKGWYDDHAVFFKDGRKKFWLVKVEWHC
jgi:cell division protease FtsH